MECRIRRNVLETQLARFRPGLSREKDETQTQAWQGLPNGSPSYTDFGIGIPFSVGHLLFSAFLTGSCRISVDQTARKTSLSHLLSINCLEVMQVDARLDRMATRVLV